MISRRGFLSAAPGAAVTKGNSRANKPRPGMCLVGRWSIDADRFRIFKSIKSGRWFVSDHEHEGPVFKFAGDTLPERGDAVVVNLDAQIINDLGKDRHRPTVGFVLRVKPMKGEMRVPGELKLGLQNEAEPFHRMPAGKNNGEYLYLYKDDGNPHTNCSVCGKRHPVPVCAVMPPQGPPIPSRDDLSMLNVPVKADLALLEE